MDDSIRVRVESELLSPCQTVGQCCEKLEAVRNILKDVPEEPPVTISQDILGENQKYHKTWMLNLADILAEVNGCKVYATKKQLVWQGGETIVLVSCQELVVAVSNLEYICEINWKAYRVLQSMGKGVPVIHGKAWKSSFYSKAVERIAEKVSTL